MAAVSQAQKSFAVVALDNFADADAVVGRELNNFTAAFAFCQKPDDLNSAPFDRVAAGSVAAAQFFDAVFQLKGDEPGHEL